MGTETQREHGACLSQSGRMETRPDPVCLISNPGLFSFSVRVKHLTCPIHAAGEVISVQYVIHSIQSHEWLESVLSRSTF